MRTALAVVALALLACVIAIYGSSEIAGEVVVLRTTDAEGEVHETRLWITRIDGADYLRAGNPQSGWLERLRASPEVEVVRVNTATRYRAQPVQEMSAAVDARLAEEYGWGDRLIGLIRPEGQSVAVRLDPLSP